MKYGGMTVNERLYVSGLMSAFDKTIEENDLEALKDIIEKIELHESYLETLIQNYRLK